MRRATQDRRKWGLTPAMRRCAAVVLILGASTACAHHISSDMDEDYGPAQLTVENQKPLDYDIYVVTDVGQSWRLGTATSLHTSTFEIPAAFVDGGAAHLHFLADPIGGDSAEVGEMVVVYPGDQIGLTIAPY